MNSFATILEIENEIDTTCHLISDQFSDADDEGLVAMIEQLVAVANALKQFAYETDEWSCFESCETYREQLREVSRTLIDRLNPY